MQGSDKRVAPSSLGRAPIDRRPVVPGARRRIVPSLFFALVIAFCLSEPHSVAAAVRASDSFAAIERQVTSLQPALVSTTVAIRAGGAAGSGAIITPDGYVLTAAHVSGRPGQKCSIILADGTTYGGQTLGCNPRTDYGLVKILSAPNLPVAPLGDSATLRPGQWVVATGHPLGPQKGRPPVLRLGRVQGLKPEDPSPTKVVTDAPLISGDSGGPLFDLNGRVVAINVMVSGNGRRDGISLHTLVNLPKYVLDRLKTGETIREDPGPSQAFADRWKQARDQVAAGRYDAGLKSLTACCAVDDTTAAVYLLMARAQLRSNQPDAALASIRRACDLGFNDADALRDDREFASLNGQAAYRQLLSRLDLWSGLPGEKRDDRPMVAAASRIAPQMGRGSARVRSGGREVALGLVMSATGDVLTKASELPDGDLTCVLADGREVRVARRVVDPKWDVALLQTNATGTQPVAFAEECVTGEWAFTPGPDGIILGDGIVGVANMQVRGRGISTRPRAGGFLGVKMDEVGPQSLRGFGLKGGVSVVVDQPDYPSARAGVRTGDVIYQVDAKVVTDPDELSDYLADKKAGDRITLYLERDGQKVQVVASLGERPEDLPVAQNLALELSGPISKMQGPFDSVVHHDTILRPNSMGGPLMNAAGKCIGMNIARADRTSSYALPISIVQGIFLRLKAQQASASNQPEPMP